jgi:lambda family phage portal protein
VNVRRAIDSFVGVFSPKAEVQRLRARLAVEALAKLSYEGASHSRRTGGWITGSTSPNAEAFGKLAELRNRSRDMLRNGAWGPSAANYFENEIVGDGIVPTPVHPDKKLRAKVKALWEAHCEQTCDLDTDGKLNVYGLQALHVRTTFESGEVLVRRRRRGPKDMRDLELSLPFQLETLEPDHLDESRDRYLLPNGGRIQAGIQFGPIAQREGMWLFKQHPGEIMGMAEPSRFVPASELLHHHPVKRPKQLRGVPALHPVLIRLRDLDVYEDASLLKQQISACLTYFLEGDAGGEVIMPGAGKAKAVEDLEPGAGVRLGPGETVKFSDPPASDNYADFVTSNLRAIAAATGMTYEALSGDYSKVNYSSARIASTNVMRAVERYRWHYLIPQVLNPLWRWFLEAAVLMGELPDVPIGVTWTPPRRQLYEPTKEVPGLRDEVRAGLKSLSEQIRESGRDPEEVWTQAAEDKKRMAELGLQFESDPAMPVRTGTPPPGDAPPAP